MGGGKVIKEGYLIKSPPLGGKGVKNWHKRFFCYKSTKMLEYYKDESDVGQKPKGFINLEDCVAINAGLVHKKHKHVLSIELKDRTYYLVASCRADMQSWVDVMCGSVFSKDSGDSSPSTSAGMSFKERFRSNSESLNSAENMFIANSVHRSVKQQLLSDSVKIEAGTKLSDAFSMKGLRGGTMTLPRTLSTSSNESESASRRSMSSTPSNSAGIPVSFARNVPVPRSEDDTSSPENPLYNTPTGTSPMGLNPNPRNSIPLTPSANPFYNTPRSMSADLTYKTPSSLPAQNAGLYNTPTHHQKQLAGSCSPGYIRMQPSSRDAPAEQQTYNTPTPQPSVPAGGELQRKTSVKSHRSALLSGPLGPSSAERPSSPHSSPKPLPRLKKQDSEISSLSTPTGSEDVPMLSSSMSLDTPPPLPPRKDDDLNTSDPSPPQLPPLPPRPSICLESESPTVNHRTKPATSHSGSGPVAAFQPDDSSDDEDGQAEDLTEFTEVPQLTEQSLHYVKLLHLSQPQTEKVKPVPLPRTSSLPSCAQSRIEYTQVKKEGLGQLLAPGAINEPLHEAEAEEEEEEESEVFVQDVQPHPPPSSLYVNINRDGTTNEETDPQYYLVMKNSEDVKPKTDGYVTFERPEDGMTELKIDSPYTVIR